MGNQDKWAERGKKVEAAGEKTKAIGAGVVGCGCLLTLLITIPIIIFLIL